VCERERGGGGEGRGKKKGREILKGLEMADKMELMPIPFFPPKIDLGRKLKQGENI